MIRTLLIICLFLLRCDAFAQEDSFQALLDSGKAEFKKQQQRDTSDYTRALRLFSEAVKFQPDNAEARYFLGYTFDRLNSNDGSSMTLSKKDLTVKASEQFEIVNRLQPKYEGELLILDPYSKISSVWGSLAMAYLSKGKADSAKWAFIQGKTRGGFIEAHLAYNRQLLSSCEKNAILIVYGDNLTIPIWYLQQIEHLRTDVLAIDANLLNTAWYPGYLKREKKLPMTYSDAALDTLGYKEWEATKMSIKNNDRVFTWTLKPTYYGHYLLKGDRVLLDILQQSLFKRPWYFCGGSDSTYNLFLEDHFGNEGIVSSVLTQKSDTTASRIACRKNLSSYTIAGVPPEQIQRSPDAITLLNTFRWGYYQASYDLYVRGKIREAKALITEMEQKFDSNKLPYTSEQFSEGVEAYKRALEQ